MPIMSSNEITTLQTAVRRDKNQIQRLKEQLKSPARMGGAIAVGGITAGLVGYARGSLEDKATGQWNVPGTEADVELVTCVVMLAASLGAPVFFKGLDPVMPYLGAATTGVVGHYMGQVGRKWAKTGKFSLIAGAPSVGALPQFDPTSYDPTQFASPYADPVAASLSTAGL